MSRDAGLAGPLELVGLRWDGGRVPLFRTEVAGRTQSVEVVFYLDEDIRGLELRVPGEAPLDLDLAREDGPGAEMGMRKQLRGFDPPTHLEAAGLPPERFSLGGADLVMAGFQASYALFAIPISWLPLAPLAGFAVVALFAATLGRKGIFLTVGAALAATLLVVRLAGPKPTLYRVLFPAEGPDSRVSGVVERHIEELPGYRRVTYAAGQGEGAPFSRLGSIELIGLWAPVGAGIPVTELVPPGARVRFSSAPLATAVGGEVLFGAGDFVTGWVLHDSH